MKLYFAAVDADANTYTSVSTGTAMDLLKQVFISLPSGEFDLTKGVIGNRVKEVEKVFATTFAGLEDPVTVIDRLTLFLTGKDRREDLASDLAEDLLIFNLVDDGPEVTEFLMNLRNIFAGEAYDLVVANEYQTSIIVRIEM